MWEGLIPLLHVLGQVRPAYGGATWGEALAYLYDTPAEAEVISALCATGVSVFDESIRVFRAEPDDRRDDDVADFTPSMEGSAWVIGNGMHRVAAAVRMGWETIRCTSVESTIEDGKVDEYVDLVFTLPDMTFGRDVDMDALDWVCGWLRSFPLPDGTWVECDSFSSRGGQMTGMWSCPATHADVLVSELHARFAEFAPTGCEGTLEIVSSRTVTGAEWDAEYEAEFEPLPT